MTEGRLEAFSDGVLAMVTTIMVLAFVAIGLVNSALSGVHAAAVCRDAVEGETGGFFTPAMVENAFRAT